MAQRAEFRQMEVPLGESSGRRCKTDSFRHALILYVETGRLLAAMSRKWGMTTVGT